MENIFYLVHTSNKYTKEWKELKASKIEEYEDQFPGVYFSLITKENIRKVDLYPNKQILIFSKRLLEQKNYHINVRDYNGFISESNTYYPWNLNDAISIINENKNNYHIGHEIIFHDPIPIEYLCLVINKISRISSNDILPNIPIENEVEPDMTKEPFYCYPLEKNYTGIEPFPESSRDFFVKMAKTCNVDTNLTNDEIVNEIKKKIPELYANRNMQQLIFLQTTGGKSKRTRKKRRFSKALSKKK